MRIFFLILYYGICRYLPSSDFPYIGLICKKMRYLCAKHIFKQCGKNVNIERLAFFGRGGNCVSETIVASELIVRFPQILLLVRML